MALGDTGLEREIQGKSAGLRTQTIVGTGEHDYGRDLNYTRNLFRLLTRDEEFGAANKTLFAEWMDIWVPRCLEAARALQPIWSTPADKAVTFASSFDAAIAKFTALLQEIELDIPEELSK
jgi:propane monooxygenase small subunit